MKEKVIVIVGPTGIGKTELALKLCEKYNGEVIKSIIEPSIPKAIILKIIITTNKIVTNKIILSSP